MAHEDGTIRALLVEDDLVDAVLLQALIDEAGGATVEMVHVRRLTTALDHLRMRPFDVVVLDLTLPDARELQALERILSIVPELPVVVLSGRGDERLIDLAFAQGAQDFLTKGSGSADELIRAIRHAIRRKRREARNLAMARRDPLTGLANRALLDERITRAILRAERDLQPFALLFLDLDGFKQINDSLGHLAGDQLLRGVARRLEAVTRQTDTVARLGGDEFVILVERLAAPADAFVIAQKVLEILARPYFIESRRCTIYGSIGIGLFPDHGASAETLLRLADRAMYTAKRAGSSGIALASREHPAPRRIVPPVRHHADPALMAAS